MSEPATKKPPNTQLSKGGSGTTLQRHVNYAATGGDVSGFDLVSIRGRAESELLTDL
jgi:hypothetical protein